MFRVGHEIRHAREESLYVTSLNYWKLLEDLRTGRSLWVSKKVCKILLCLLEGALRDVACPKEVIRSVPPLHMRCVDGDASS